MSFVIRINHACIQSVKFSVFKLNHLFLYKSSFASCSDFHSSVCKSVECDWCVIRQMTTVHCSNSPRSNVSFRIILFKVMWIASIGSCSDIPKPHVMPQGTGVHSTKIYQVMTSSQVAHTGNSPHFAPANNVEYQRSHTLPKQLHLQEVTCGARHSVGHFD